MTIAQQIKTLIETHKKQPVFSLYASYIIGASKSFKLPRANSVLEQRDNNGRCIRAVYRYADGSKLICVFNEKTRGHELSIGEV